MVFDFLKPKQPTDKLGQPISQAPNALSKVLEPPKTVLTPYINSPTKSTPIQQPTVSKYIPNHGSSSPTPPKINEPTPVLITQPTDKLGQPISQAPTTLNQIVAPKPTILTPSLPVTTSKPVPQPEPNSLVPYKPVTSSYSIGYGKEINRPLTEGEARSLGLNYVPTTSTNPNAPVRVILPNQNLVRNQLVTPKDLTVGQARDYVKNVINQRIESKYKSESNKVISQLLPSYQEQANRIADSNLSDKEKTKQIESLSIEYSNKVNEITRTGLSSDKEFINAQNEYINFSKKFNLGTDIYGNNYYKDLEQTQFDKNKQTLKDIKVLAVESVVPATMLLTAPSELKYKGNINQDIQNKVIGFNKIDSQLTPEGKVQAALATAMIIGPAAIEQRIIAKEIQNIRLADLINKKPVYEVGISDKLSTGDLDTQAILKATQKTPYGKIETFTNIKSLNLGEDLVTVAGKGKQKIEIYDIKKLGSVSDKEALIKTTKDFKFSSEMPLDIIKGENILKPIGKGTKQQLSNEVSGVSGNVLVDITGEKQLRQVNVGGFSKQDKDLIYVVSGEGRKVRVPKIENINPKLSTELYGINEAQAKQIYKDKLIPSDIELIKSKNVLGEYILTEDKLRLVNQASKKKVYLHELGHKFISNKDMPIKEDIYKSFIQELKDKGVMEEYVKRGYKENQVPEEFFSDIFASKSLKFYEGKTNEILSEKFTNKFPITSKIFKERIIEGVKKLPPEEVLINQLKGKNTISIPYSFEVAPEAKVLVEPQKLSVIKVLSEEDKKPLFDIVNKELSLKGNLNKEAKFLKEDALSQLNKLEGNKIELYHATNTKNVNNILNEGLIPSKASGIHGVIGENDKVFLAISKDTAEKYALMSGEPRTVLKVKIPKDVFYDAIAKEKGVGTIGQVKLNYVSPDFIEKPNIKTIRELESGSSKLIQEAKPLSIKESVTVSNQVMKELEKSSLETLNKPNIRLTSIKPQVGFKSIAELQNKPKSQTLSLTGIKSRQTTSNKLNQELATVTRSRSRTVSLTSQSSGVSDFNQPTVKEALKSEQVTKQQLKQLTRQVNIPVPPIRPNIKNPIPELDLVPPSGYGNQEGYGSKELKKLMQKNKRRKPSYTASLGAALFETKPIKVTQKEYDRLSKTTFSGAETRPILEIIKPKKRKV